MPLQIVADFKDLPEIRSYVHNQSEALGINGPAIDDILSAVTEVVENILMHGYPDGSGPIEIEIRRDKRNLRVYIRDHARPFDPTRVPPPDTSLPLAKRPIGGLGIFLARHFVDRIKYRYTTKGWNELVLIKQAPFQKIPSDRHGE